MQRKYFRGLIIGVVIVACAGLSFALIRVLQAQRAKEKMLLNFFPQAAQRIQEFRRVKMQKGKKVWEIAAREARYFEDDQQISVSGPEMVFYLRDGRQLSVRGEEGIITVDNREVERVVLQGPIEVRVGEYVITTAEAIYDRDHDSIYAPGPVAVAGTRIQVRGDQLQLHLAEARLTLFRHVTMTLVPG